MTYCYKIGNFKGEKGEKGTKGDKGEKGDKGDKGDTGDRGRDGVNATADTPTELLTKIKTVDGSSSGLDSDLLDGKDSSYFATADDVESLSTVQKIQLGSPRFWLIKSGKTVYFHVQAWENAQKWSTSTYQWIADIPEGFRPPAVVPSSVEPETRVYVASPFGNAVRMRATSSGKIECRVFPEMGEVPGKFYGFATWVTDE